MTSCESLNTIFSRIHLRDIQNTITSYRKRCVTMLVPTKSMMRYLRFFHIILLLQTMIHYWSSQYNGPPVKTTHEKIIVNQIIPYQPILSPEPPWYRSAQRNCPAEQGCLDRLGLAGTMPLARCPQLLNPLRTLTAAAQPARTRLSGSVACDAKQLW